MDIAFAIEQANEAKGPDLTNRLDAVLDRLRPVPIGGFSMAEFEVLRRYLKWRDQSTGPFRLEKCFEGIPEGRDPAAELRVILQLESIAEKARV